MQVEMEKGNREVFTELERVMDFGNEMGQNVRFREIQTVLLAEENWSSDFIDKFCTLASKVASENRGTGEVLKGALGEAIVKRIWRSGVDRWIADANEINDFYVDSESLDKNKVDLRGFVERDGVVWSVDIQVKSMDRLNSGDYWLINATRPGVNIWLHNRSQEGRFRLEVIGKMRKAVKNFKQSKDRGDIQMIVALGCGEKEVDQHKKMMELVADLKGDFVQSLLNDLEKVFFPDESMVEAMGIIHQGSC